MHIDKTQKFPIGISDFKEIVQTQSTFIDKTLFVKDILENYSKVILITRPRRFGKTMNLSMLGCFLDHDEDQSLFDGLKISKETEFCARHQNKYPVIFLSFKDIKDKHFDLMYSDIKDLFATLYKNHDYLLEGNLLSEAEKSLFKRVQNKNINDPSDLSFALFHLTSYVKKKYGVAPILLLDEYDTPIHSAYANNCYEDMVNLMRKILGSALKDNPNLNKAVLTGILRISQESLFSGLNNIRVYSILDNLYAPYFGFSEEEVQSLLPEGLEIDPIRDWYNGYRIGGAQVYNPWSIINCLENNGERKPYWVNTSDNALVFGLIEGSDLQEEIQKLIEGNTLRCPLTETLTFSYLEDHEEAVWSLLLHTGYLNATQTYYDELRGLQADLCIPNKEVFSIYTQMVRSWFSREKKTSDYFSLLSSLEMGDVQTFVRLIREYIQASGSYFDFSKTTPERVFHSFMLGLLVGLQDRYTIQSNRETGLGRADMIFVPKDASRKGIVLEFKVCKNASDLTSEAHAALAQIKEKQYTQPFKGDVLLIGMAFCGKEMIAEHTVFLQANVM